MVLRLDNRRVKECLHVTLHIKLRASAMANGCIAAAFAIAPATAAAAAVAAAAAFAFAPAPDLLHDLCRDCDIKLLVFKLHLQWRYDGDVLASRVQVRVPRVRGSRDQAGGALPFTRSPPAAPDHRHKLDRPHKSRARCWPVQRRNWLRLELDGGHHRRRG